MRLLFLCLLFPVFALAAVGFGVSAPGTVDTRPPEITPISPAEGDEYEGEVNFEWTISEDSLSLAPEAVQLFVLEADSVTVLYEFSTPMLPSGNYLHHWTVPGALPSGTFWRVEARDAFGNFSRADGAVFDSTDGPESLDIPASLTLGNAWPNPFNPTTQLRFSIPESGPVSLEIYDLSGRHVESLFRGTLERGWQEFLWKAEGQASGVYLALLKTNTEIRSTKLVLLK